MLYVYLCDCFYVIVTINLIFFLYTFSVLSCVLFFSLHISHISLITHIYHTHLSHTYKDLRYFLLSQFVCVTISHFFSLIPLFIFLTYLIWIEDISFLVMYYIYLISQMYIVSMYLTLLFHITFFNSSCYFPFIYFTDWRYFLLSLLMYFILEMSHPTNIHYIYYF